MGEQLIVISARTEEQLRVYLTTLRDYLSSSQTPSSLADIAFTLQRGRESFDERFALIVKTKSELLNLLTVYLESGASSSVIFRGGKKESRYPLAVKPDEQKQLYENKNLRIAAAWWTHHIDVDWEQLNEHSDARRISLPTYPFERKRCWVAQETFSPPDKPMETGELVAEFYNKMTPYMKELLGTEDPHLIFSPLAEKIEGFSWVLIYNEPEKHPEHAAIIASKQKEAKQILYHGVDFSKVHKVMDIGCGFSTDLIDLSMTYPHITGDGFTIASNQAQEGANRVLNKGLDNRLRIFCKDSSKDPFPGLYDLVIGFEVFPHIEHKQKTFENIYRHLNQDGRILLADCVANTVTEINMPKLAMFTSTAPQYSKILSDVGLKLIECVDISVEISNFLDDPEFENNFAYLCSVNPIIKQFEQEYRGWYSFGQGIKKKVLRYLLLTIGKADPDQTKEELLESNQRQFDYPVFYKQASDRLTPESSGQRKHTITTTYDEVDNEFLEKKLVEFTSREMEMEPDAIDIKAQFADYGVGSLQGVLLIDAINREFDLKLKIQVIYDYSSIRELSQFLVTNYGQTLKSSLPKSDTLKQEAIKVPTQTVTQALQFDKQASDYLTIESSEQKTHPITTTVDNEFLEKKLVEITSREMEMEPDAIDIKAQFADYGVGSLQGVLLIDAINREFDLKLKIQVIYDYSSIRELSQFLVTNYSKTLKSSLPKSETLKQEAIQVVTQAPQVKNTTDIAVIGMSGRFPGADNTSEFWENLRQGIDSITEVPPSRWDVQKYYDPDPQKPNRSYSKWGGFLRDVDKFDPLFFNLSPVEAEVMDPQQRLFLESCWHTLEDAGYVGQRLDSVKCGVFAGVIYNDYKALLYKHGLIKNHGQVMLGNANSILASRVAYFLNLRGPVMTIDTACSSSLMAIHLACKSLREGETDIMLAGGVTLYLSEQLYVEMSKAGMVSPTGKCRAFDNSADGLVVGEAVGVVALKRLDRAIADGDMIYGVIKGTGTNQDGKTNGITAPSAKSQSELELAVYQQFDIHPESISYVEAHGTGTKLGDPIEVEALTQAFRTHTTKKQYCALASVKSNIGHTSAAAGVVSLMKVLLSLRHKMIPPTLYVERENIHNDFAESPFYINKKLRDWQPNSSYPRRAAINSFGFSGSNCHIVVEEYQEELNPSSFSYRKGKPVLIVLSAKNKDRLKEMAENFCRYLHNSHNIDLSRLAYTLQVGRLAMEERLSLIVFDSEELREKLMDYIEGRSDRSHVYHGSIQVEVGLSWSREEICKQTRASLDELAKLWIKGVEIDWSVLYPDATPKIMSLPTYPFARERYWIPEDPQATGEEEPQDTGEKDNPPSDRVTDKTLEDSRQEIETYLQDILSTALKIPAAKIQASTPFEKYGIDSVMILSLNRELESHFGELPSTLFFERQNLSELAQYFIEHHQAALLKKREKVPTEKSAARLISVESSSPTKKKLAVDSKPISAVKPVSQQLGQQCQEIAIIGISGRYPQADNVATFWENLKTGKNCVTEIPQERWDYRQYYDPQKNKRGKSYCKWGGFINNVDRFDPLFFNIAPKEAQIMDPQERLFLQTAWETIEDSGYTRAKLEQEKVGVFVGALYLEYQLLGVEETAKGSPMFLGYSLSSIANRVSYFFNFNGPSLAVDTMCSSSLTAIHLACESIRHGDCNLALAGGVNLALHPNKYLQLGQNGFASSDGRCRSFGEGGDGYVPGEGIGAILLKPLDQAIKDEDHIYAIIKGSSLNHGGKTNGYTVPNPNAQGLLIKEVLERANVNARTISYLEAHGTGTELGDPIEISGLMQAYQQTTDEKQFCRIGSAKANIGHLEAAAGIAAVTKVVLQLKHKQLPPSIHSETVNPNIRFEQSPFCLQRKLETWERPVIQEGDVERTYPLRAGISSFGAGGANAHLILEEYVERRNKDKPNADRDGQSLLFLLSAKNENRLKEYARKLFEFISVPSSSADVHPSMQSIAYTLQVGREAMEERLALIASSREELGQKLLQYYQGLVETEHCYQGSVQTTETEMKTLLQGEIGEIFVRQLLGNQELGKLAALWTKGVNIDWQLLYSEPKPKRSSLPTYPFAQKRYWIPEVGMSKETKSQVIYSHPLLDGFDVQKSLGTGAVFYKTLSYTDWIVSDHQVKNQPVLPGVGILEIAIAAFSSVRPNEQYNIARVLWLQPVIVSKEGKKINIVISQKDKGFGFEIRCGDTIHAQGEFILAREKQDTKEPPLSIEDIKTRCSRRIDKLTHYTTCREKGVDYGVHFQGIEQIWGNDEEALGLFQLPACCDRGFQQYQLHPTLVDSALQTIAGLFNPLQTNSGQPMLPYAVEKVEQVRPLPTRGYAHIKILGKSRYNVVVADEQGQACLTLSDVVLRKLKDPLAEFFYAPSWMLEEKNHPPLPTTTEEIFLLVYPLFCLPLADTIAHAHSSHECFRFQLDSTSGKQGKNLWQVKADDSLAWHNCILALKEKVGLSPLTIYFLSGNQTKWAGDDNLEILEQSQQQGILSLFRLFKGIISHNFTGRLRWKVLTNRVYEIKPEETIDPRTASLQGFTSSLAREYPQLEVSCLDIDIDDFAGETTEENRQAWVSPILTEPPHPQGEAVALRRGRRYLRKLLPINLPAIAKIPFRTQGVYFILGGAGGIGLELCRYLTETVQAKIILVGRSELDAQKQETIRTIESKGGEILYLKADATDLDSMKKAIAQARNRYGKIHGVFHSAIILKDKTLENMDESTLRMALDIKVRGSVILHKTFEDESLDFMLFFSSAISLSGNAGQANYAAGCTFKDAYAHSLAKKGNYPVKVINWGYWGTVGIVASEEFNRKLAAAGLYSIQPEQGMESVSRLLSHPLHQVMSINANQKFLEGINVDFSYELAFSPQETPSTLHTLIDRTLGGFNESENIKKCFVEIDRLGLHLTLQCFHQAGVFQNADEEYNKQQLRTRLSITPDYWRLFDELLNILARAGWIRIQGEQIISTTEVESASVQEAIKYVEEERNQLLASYPEMKTHINLVWVCMSACLEVLRGEIAGTDVMFPNSSMERVEGIYKGNAQVDHYNQSVALNVLAYIRHCMPKLGKNGKIKILEVGAGTGSTSTMIFDAVREYGEHLTYVYTDISPSLINYGRKNFEVDNPFVDFKILDVERDVEAQGYELFDFDIVIATNVFHATRRINNTLRHAKALLKTNGWLIINEGVKNLDFLTYTFGLLKGWWLYDEKERLPGGPTLSLAIWRNVLQEEGFGSILSLNESSQARLDFGQDVIIAESNGIIRRNLKSVGTPTLTKTNSVKSQSPSILSAKPEIVRKKTDVKTYIQESIAENLVLALDISQEDINIKKPLSEYGVDSITGVDIINRINKTFKLQLRTTVLFDHANIESFANALFDEYSEQIQTLLASEPLETLETLEHLQPLETSTSVFHQDWETVDSFGVNNTQVEKIKEEEKEKGLPPTYQAVFVNKSGFPEDLEIRGIQPTAPGEGEVEIEVRACSLNLADVLCMRGLYPNMPPYPFTPGSEISGVVLRTGAKVQRFQPGNEVIAVMGQSMGGHSGLVLVREENIVKKPSGLTHEEASSFPVAFLTMNHAFNLANVKPGEKVLIQTAAGGIGLIAVQLASLKGAQIYATAGSPAKLAYLNKKGVNNLINYRTEDFGKRILEMTNGQGVDVIFNTLSDDAIQKGLNLLAPGGRYIEIAMTGLKNSRPLDLSHLVDNQTFQSIDMSRLYTKQPKLLTEHLALMAQVLAEGKIRPTLSHSFSFAQIRNAYECLQQRENIGKVVVTFDTEKKQSVSEIPTEKKQLVSQDNEVNTEKKQSIGAIAVIGMSGRFPGAATVEEFWHNLANGKDSIIEVPAERWDINAYYNANPQHLDKTHCKWGGFVTDIDKFDALFFKLSGREAELTDPQQRLFLEEAWKALEDAGYANNASISNTKCGVFVGADPGDYRLKMQEAGVPSEPQSFWGNAGSLIAARISYFLNLKGPSITVDTACSSSLVAIHLGCQSIHQGESDMVIVGGVYIGTTPNFHIVASNARMLAPDGKCKTFDQRADGFVPGEGVGAVVLKPLAAARKDGDHIYGVILGSGCNQDGRTYGITAPSAASQSELEQNVYLNANLNPSTISYVEAHGTGTKLGDPIEIDALTKAFQGYTDKKGYCAIGSVKSNIGHAATAAGIVGFIKVLLCLQHRKLVPSLNFEKSNEHIDFENSPFYVNRELKNWLVEEGKLRRAAISSFGFSGTNAHIVVEEYQEKEARKEEGIVLILLSAKNHDRLKQVAGNLYRFMLDNPSYTLSDIAYTLQVGRETMETRVAFIVNAKDALLQKLLDFLANKTNNENFYLGEVKGGEVNPSTVSSVDLLAALTNRELEKLAAWWVSGLTLDWTQLPRTDKLRRVPLPTYPFSPDRYWFDSSATVSMARLKKDYIFKKELKSTEPLLAQHTIDGKPVFPSVGFLEMLLDCLNEIIPNQAAVLQELFWLTPLYVLDQYSVHLVVEVEQDTFKYRFIGGEADENTVYCRGHGYWVQSLEPLPALDINHLKSSIPKQTFPEEPYRAFETNRVVLGSLYQGATAAWAAGGKALIAIDILIQQCTEYLFHPATFVAALLACRWLDSSQQEVGIPFFIEKVERWHDVEQPAYAYVVQGAQKELDVQILDRWGQVAVRYSGIKLKTFKTVNLEKLLYVPVWQRLADRNTTSHQQQTNGTTLLVYDRENRSEAEKLLKIYQARQQEVLSVCLPDTNNYQFDYLENQLKQLTSPLCHICFLATANETLLLSPNSFWKTVHEPWYVMGLLTLVRRLEQLGYAEKPLQWILLTNRAYALHPEDQIDPYASVIVGLATSLAQEHIHWQVNLCDRHNINISPSSGNREDFLFPPLLVNGNGDRQSLNVVVERNGNAYVRKLEGLDLPRPTRSRLRNKGIYVLAGGAGHVGGLLTQYLVQTYQAEVIWLGRREQDESINKKIEAIATFGPRPQYITLKNWDEAETKAVFDRIKQEKNTIHGIFNLVMTAQGIPISSLSEEQFRAGSFDGKVKSALALYSVLKNEPLDFLVFFSSMQSFAQRLKFMSANMSSYIAGCMFQDALAHEMNRQGAYPVKTINWGYWSHNQEEDFEETHEQYEAYLKKKGIYSLNAEEGMESLERILAHKSEQVVMTKASDEIIKNLGVSVVKNTLIASLPDRSSMLNRLLAEADKF
jgi:acyl transferase domain-containing protein/NADPH:quinone reductase-like Zn-dependent oxidoreductase/SAM-dependent methyltransferase/NADP-dependent 3-hydroxy acid dehydrogenase YdfG